MALTLVLILALLCGAQSASFRPNSSTAKYPKSEGVLDSVLDGTLDSKPHSADSTLDLLASDKLRRSVMEDIKVLLDSQVKALLKNGIDRVSGLLRRKIKPKHIPRSSESRSGKKNRKVDSLETLETENRNSDFIKVLTDDSLQDPDDKILRDAVDELLKQNKDNVIETKNGEDVSENMKDHKTTKYYHKENKNKDTVSEDEDVISQYFYDKKKNKRNMKNNHKKDLNHDSKHNLPGVKQENDNVVEKNIDLDTILKSALQDFSALSQEDENTNDDDNEKNTHFETNLTSTSKDTLKKLKGKKYGDSALQDNSSINLDINENENSNSGKQKINTDSDSKQSHFMSRSSKHGHHKRKKLVDPHPATILESENNENDKQNIGEMNHPEKSFKNTEEDNTHTDKTKQNHRKGKRHHNEKPGNFFHKDDTKNDKHDIEIDSIATDIVLNNTITSYESTKARQKDQVNNDEDKNNISKKNKKFYSDTLLESNDVEYIKDKTQREKKAYDENKRIQESVENISEESKKYGINNSASHEQQRKENEGNVSEEHKHRSYERENSEIRTVHSFINKKKLHPSGDNENDISTEKELSEERTVEIVLNKNQLRSVTEENNDKSAEKDNSEEDSLIKYLSDKKNQYQREKDTYSNEDDSVNSGTEENKSKEIVKVRNAPEEKKSHQCHNKKEEISSIESGESNLIRDLIQNKDFKKSFSFSLNFTS